MSALEGRVSPASASASATTASELPPAVGVTTAMGMLRDALRVTTGLPGTRQPCAPTSRRATKKQMAPIAHSRGEWSRCSWWIFITASDPPPWPPGRPSPGGSVAWDCAARGTGRAFQPLRTELPVVFPKHPNPTAPWRSPGRWSRGHRTVLELLGLAGQHPAGASIVAGAYGTCALPKAAGCAAQGRPGHGLRSSRGHAHGRRNTRPLRAPV